MKKEIIEEWLDARERHLLDPDRTGADIELDEADEGVQTELAFIGELREFLNKQ